MPDVPDRADKEEAYARLMAKLLQAYGGRLLEKLGDPPSLDNLPKSFWDAEAKELVKALSPFGERVYLDAARQLIEKSPISIDWGLVNQRAIDWSREHTGEWLAQKINETTRDTIEAEIDRLRTAIPEYFDRQMTRGDLEQRLQEDGLFGPVRAEMIAVTEVTRAAVEGERELARQLEVEGIVMTPIWQTSNDDLVCLICEPLNEKPITDDFFPPGHPRCLPGNTLVLPIGGIACGSERWYEGDIVTIETLENKLTITPNHPILTDTGWVAAGLIDQGDYVLGYSASDWKMRFVQFDEQYRITSIENIFGSLGINGLRVPTSPPDFHGDGANTKITVIRPNREVMNTGNAHLNKPLPEGDLAGGDIVIEVPLARLGAQAQLLERNDPAAGDIVSGLDLASALLDRHFTPFDGFGLGLIPGDNISVNQTMPESPAAYTSLLSELVLRFPGHVSLQKVIKISKNNFSGHVYNLQTESGLYVADGIITHNCRCGVSYELPKVV